MKNYLVAILLAGIFLKGSVFASVDRVTVSGYLTDASSGESLIGANIYIPSLNIGTSTNSYGFYSISTLASDSVSIIFSYVGYENQIQKIILKGNIKLDIQLVPIPITIDDIVVTGHKENENVERKQMGAIDISGKTIEKLPAILGETDVLKVIQLLPGVQSGQEGTTGFYVRGGNADQNMILLDEAVVYNPNHLFGLVSTFNSRAINNVTMIKGGFPAEFGGRLSSILDISLKDGNSKEYHVDGGIGFITSKLTVEGPILKDRASFILSARRTYLDLLLKAFSALSKNDYSFYDINAKLNYKISENDRIFLSFFTGHDDASYIDVSSLNYGFKFGNTTGTLRWNHLFGEKLFANTSLIYNSYLMNLKNLQTNYYSEFYSEIKDINAKTDFEYFLSPNNTVKFGFNYTHHTIIPTGTSGKVPKNSAVSSLNTGNVQKKIADEGSIYLNDEFDLTSRLGVNMGLRVSGFKHGKANYYGIEPRATIKYTLTPQSSVKTAYTVMNQYLHLVPSSTASFPTDIWLPSSAIVKPQRSEQVSLGYYHNFDDNKYEASLETYYKTMQHQVAFKEGAHLVEQTNIDNELVFGKGWSYGMELLFKKSSGRLSGWIAYTLSWTNQQFDDLNFGKAFPFKYDKRHDLSLVGVYKLSNNWELSGDFVFTTGNAITLPEGRVNVFEGGNLFNGVFDVYTSRNNYRLRSYHRLDLSISYKHKASIFGANFDGELVVSIYNVYSRLNPYFVYLDVDSVTKAPVAKQVSLLPIIPSISYNFKF